ncbi:MAG: oxalate:formate antiporter [Oscillospiraceae bacterium]|nr:oxalate:formate antiporter [Oscillospiraceae bacterium]
MKHTAKIIPCYAADTAGACSALYELGGLTVVHDASGCNSTYATFDEPRWWDKQSMTYISALTELDAILGNDEKLIADTAAAAADQNPRFIAVCGSPMPMMIGVDFDAVAAEIGQRTGIRTVALHTNGMHSYPEGASEALRAAAELFVQPAAQKRPNGVNLLGATPLDFGNLQTVPHIRAWLQEAGFSVVSCFAMGDTPETLAQAAEASVSLVLSECGFAAAEYLYERFGIPYVCGVPYGAAFSAQLAASLRQSAETGAHAYPCALRGTAGKKITVIGEAVSAGSIAAQLSLTGFAANVICPLPHHEEMLGAADSDVFAEDEIESALADMQPDAVIADPFYRFILPNGTRHIELPHYAFSGRCFDKIIPDLTAARFDAWAADL